MTEEEIGNDIGTTWNSRTYRKITGCGSIYVSISFRNEAPEKVELVKIEGCAKVNACGNSNMEAIADLLTFSIRRIRNKYEAEAIIKALRRHRCNKYLPNKDHITSCADAIGQVIQSILFKDEEKTESPKETKEASSVLTENK